jgi:Family of unknown function (DUF5923)
MVLSTPSAEKLKCPTSQVDAAAPKSKFTDGDVSIKETFKSLGSEVQDAHESSNKTGDDAAKTNGFEQDPLVSTRGDGFVPGSLDADAPLTTGSTVPAVTVEDGPESPTSEATDSAGKKTFKSRMAGLKGIIRCVSKRMSQYIIIGRAPDKHRTAAKDQYAKTKKFLTEEYFPKDRRDQFIFRLKKVVVECQSHPKYKEALEWFLVISK